MFKPISLAKLHIKTSYGNSFSDLGVGLWVMVFNTTFKNISVISLGSVLLVEETGLPGENH